ncbi:MAG TPA: DUF1801 domain-containing protein [Verrucomicrobiae bacterium]|nr:DUF1801 domain-containing protein [Verrucomicrobiae bacterium]
MNNVEIFIEQKVLPQYKEIVTKFRELVREKYPELKEEMRGGTEKYPGVPVYRLKRIVITISPTKQGITFAFTDGGQFQDKYNQLEGAGHKTLNLRLKSIDEFDEAQMQYYIDQAIKLQSAS